MMRVALCIFAFMVSLLGTAPAQSNAFGGSGNVKLRSAVELKRQSDALSGLLKSDDMVVKQILAIFTVAYEADSFDGGKEGTRNGHAKDGIITLEEAREHLRTVSSYVKGDEEGKMYRFKELLPDGDPDPNKLNLKLGVQNSFKKLEDAHPELLSGIRQNPALQELIKAIQERTHSANLSLYEAIQQDLLDGNRTALYEAKNHPFEWDHKKYRSKLDYETALQSRLAEVEEGARNTFTPKAVVKHARELTGYRQ